MIIRLYLNIFTIVFETSTSNIYFWHQGIEPCIVNTSRMPIYVIFFYLKIDEIDVSFLGCFIYSVRIQQLQKDQFVRVRLQSKRSSRIFIAQVIFVKTKIFFTSFCCRRIGSGYPNEIILQNETVDHLISK